ncbi:hypothetical protein [uncultured Treponema sp.]|uniref:hypothetical protein n=1 Tax=uncultured Treponema sp. TaxID=162155 RepID=UPI0025973F7C|nr:hypothetical protein [uncultured Treponema sp.]
MARYARNDRFGNPYILVGCKDNGKGYPVGYVELGGKLYKVEPSESKKEGVLNWVKVTRVQKQNRHQTM